MNQILRFIHKLFIKRKIFLIGDTHFDHKNIIRYTKRSFKSVKHMNNVLMKNWNRVVGKRDIVYFLGDLTLRNKKISYWLSNLNGHIIFIAGNHDIKVRSKYKKRFLKYNDTSFLLIHNPHKKPKDWKGWTVHGHVHNNNLRKYPFVNGKTKTINVSCELIKFTPLNIDILFKKDFTNISKWVILNTKPFYKKK